MPREFIVLLLASWSVKRECPAPSARPPTVRCRAVNAEADGTGDTREDPYFRSNSRLPMAGNLVRAETPERRRHLLELIRSTVWQDITLVVYRPANSRQLFLCPYPKT